MSSHLIKASLLARNLGISRYTVRDWCQKQPGFAVKRKGDWFVRIDELAKRDGLDPVRARTLTSCPWLKAVDLAALAGIPRRTVAYWARTRPKFGVRIGRIWYVDPIQLGATTEQVEMIELWYPQSTSVIGFLRATGAK